MKTIRIISAVILGIGLLWMLFAKSCGSDKDDDFSPPSNDKNKTEKVGGKYTPPATNDTTFVGTTPCSPDISYKFDIYVTAPVYIKYTGASEAVYCEEGDDVKPPAGSKAGPVTITAATKKQAEIVVIRKN